MGNRPFNDDGTLTDYDLRSDWVSVDPETGQLQVHEAKSSDDARLTRRQTTGHPLLARNGGVIVGKMGGDIAPAKTLLPPQKVNEITPSTMPGGPLA